jgi:hypothetical protein
MGLLILQWLVVVVFLSLFLLHSALKVFLFTFLADRKSSLPLYIFENKLLL